MYALKSRTIPDGGKEFEIEDKRKFKSNADSKLMNQIHEVLRYYHYAYRTETYCKLSGIYVSEIGQLLETPRLIRVHSRFNKSSSVYFTCPQPFCPQPFVPSHCENHSQSSIAYYELFQGKEGLFKRHCGGVKPQGESRNEKIFLFPQH